MSTPTPTQRAIDAVWRIESARVIAALTRLTCDVAIAEELAQEALLSALQKWPEQGIPDNPGAWLMLAAKHRAVDMFRRDKRGSSRGSARRGLPRVELSAADAWTSNQWGASSPLHAMSAPAKEENRVGDP